MPKGYKNRQMATERVDKERVFVFPKTDNGPVAIEAKNRKEAEKKLKELNKQENG